MVEQNGLWATSGARTFASWLRQRTSSTAGSASAQVRQTRALRRFLPLTAQALGAGWITPEHVAILVRETTRTDQLRAQLGHSTVGEQFLVEQAAAMDAGTFAQVAKSWAIAADPVGADRAWRESGAKEELTISQTLGGFHLTGWLDEVSGQVITTALGAHAGRKAEGDERTAAQRRAAALVSLARQSLDTGRQGSAARVRPHLTVTCSLQTLRALAQATGSAICPGDAGSDYTPTAAAGALIAPGGPRDHQIPHPIQPGRPGEPSVPSRSRLPGQPGRPDGTDAPGGVAPFHTTRQVEQWLARWQPADDHVISSAIDLHKLRHVPPATLEDGTPLVPAQLARLLCESDLSRVVLGSDSTILDVGREKRIFPANQARGVIARDRHCQYPGCHEPPGYGEIHHSLWWTKHHGPTSTDHGILLCWHHHDHVHANDITITRRAGQWYFTDRTGRPISHRTSNHHELVDAAPAMG